MKTLSVFALAAIMTFAIAVSAQNTSDTPADQPQAATEMQSDQQAPAAQSNDEAPVAEPAPAPEAPPAAEASPTSQMAPSDEAAPLAENAPVGEVSAEEGAWILEPTPDNSKSVLTNNNEEGQNAATAAEYFPDLYY